MSQIWRYARRFVLRHVLHTGDSPHQVGLGAAIATFVAFLPIMGFQTVAAVALAALARANKAICIPVVWITNPATAVPIYASCWWIGRILLTGSSHDDPTAFALNIKPPPEYSGFAAFAHVHEAAFWKYLMVDVILSFGAELWLGCTLVGIVAAAMAYLASRWSVTAYRQRRAARKLGQRSFIRPSIRTSSPRRPREGTACIK